MFVFFMIFVIYTRYRNPGDCPGHPISSLKQCRASRLEAVQNGPEPLRQGGGAKGAAWAGLDLWQISTWNSDEFGDGLTWIY